MLYLLKRTYTQEVISMMRNNRPMVIGITGGVGAGKTELLKYIGQKTSCLILHGDEIAGKLQEPDESCYAKLTGLLGKGILSADGTIDRKKMAAVIFSDSEKLAAVNAVVHPEVERYIRKVIETERAEKRFDYIFIEAALLIECGYGSICDELWYVYADSDSRRSRLRSFRGYEDERIDGIMRSQADDAAFREKCAHVIDNSGSIEDTHRQIDILLSLNGGKES